MSARLIYLHGFASGPSSKKARYFGERLAERGTDLAVPDLTEGAFERLTISSQLRVIEREAGGEPVSLIGSSLGAYLAALYAARHPEVERVVMMAPAFSFSSLFPPNVGDERMEQWRRDGRLSVFNYAAKGMTDLGWQLMEDARTFEDFPRVYQPALIFHGKNDESVPIALSERFAAAHPNATLRRLDSDHELIDVLAPMCDEALAFLRV